MEMMKTNTMVALVVLLFFYLLLLCGIACADDLNQPTITTDKSDYKCGEVVTITYNFQHALEKGVTPRISIYQDPELILHVVTWDAHGTTGVQQWKTDGLWDGTYYIVAKHHHPVGLLYNEEIVAISKFTLNSGVKLQQSLVSMLEQARIEAGLDCSPILTPSVYAIQKEEVVAWFASAC